MKILIFTEGTIIMHRTAVGHSRLERVSQVLFQREVVHNYESYVPVGKAVNKLINWKEDGAEIYYLTSRTKPDEISQVQSVITKHGFPDGKLFFRLPGEEYKNVAERIMPDVLVEDDCQSIGGINEMTITHIRPDLKSQIKSIPVKEFGGIDHLPDNISALINS